MAKTIQEINEKIKKGKAVVYTAEEIIDVVKKKGVKKAAAEVDLVTTGTFAPMCSSGAYFNPGHANPRIKLGGGQVTLNDVPVYTGFAAVDFLVGATAIPDDDPRNKIYPGKFPYGGGHLIEDLVAGKDVRLVARAYGTDCYPRRKLETWIRLEDMNEAVLFNTRNAYQNYNVAVNLSDRIIHTYMGVLHPELRNATYCSAGQLSPLLNDPFYRTIGVGTRIFLGGGIGYVVERGTQHNPSVPRTEQGVPRMGAGTLALMGDLKQMSNRWLRGASFVGYGVTLAVGIGIPIPILDEETLRFTTVTDADIVAQVVDYSEAYPKCVPGSLGEVSYAQLKSGSVTVNGKEIPTAGLSSYARAREVAGILKDWVETGSFLLSEPVAPLPSADSGVQFKPLNERPIVNNNKVAVN
ncbi:MAG: homocysteine biosynthesis protein [Deltaproteobacteria bacterium]|nr:MAG: homocysteine biosynthesis protein [Deltaproteobacteria bacterium]